MKTRLRKEELALAHDGMCGITLKDGPCSCLVHWMEALQQEADEANLQLDALLAMFEKYDHHLYKTHADWDYVEGSDGRRVQKMRQGHTMHPLAIRPDPVAVASAVFNALTPEHRRAVADTWCRSCFNAGPKCQCGNDE